MKLETRFTWNRCKGTAEGNLGDVERHIKSRNGLNLIPDELSSAIHWAIQGWLSQKGIAPNVGNGWHSMTLQFHERANKPLADEASYLLSAASRLEFDMFEIETEVWINQASILLSRAKEFMKSMQDELFSSDENA